MDGWANVFHNVGNGECFGFESDLLAGGGGRAGRVDVHGDWIGGGFVVEVEEFGDDEFGDGWDEGHADVDDAVVEEEGGEVGRWTNSDSCVSVSVNVFWSLFWI